MTTITIIVDDERKDSLERILREIPYVKDIKVEGETQNEQLQEPPTQYDRIKKVLDAARGKDLFKDIKDPVEWQRQIRKEWDRDF